MKKDKLFGKILGLLLFSTGIIFACPTPKPGLSPTTVAVGGISQVQYVQADVSGQGYDSTYNNPPDPNDQTAPFKPVSYSVNTTISPANGGGVSSDGKTITWNVVGTYTVTITVVAKWENKDDHPCQDSGTKKYSVTVIGVDIHGANFVKVYYDGTAPNITLNAIPTPVLQNGTYSWSVTQGGNKVQFVGDTSAKTVAIKGLAESAANNDVQVTVTYTVGNVSCVANHTLTVQKPTKVIHGALKFILKQKTILGVPVSFAAGAKKFAATLYDQLGNTMAGVPFSENIVIDMASSIPSSGYLPFANTGSGNTNPSGQYSDIYAIPVLGSPPSDMSIKIHQDIFFGGYKGLNDIIITDTSVSDSYPVTLTNP